jgi:hypothetical protein
MCTAGNTPDFEDPMRRWLESNGITMDRIPMWPEIELHEDGIQMRIELLYREHDRAAFMLKAPVTHMSAWLPLVHPLPPELWEIYSRNRKAAKLNEVIDRIGKAGATIVHIKGGDQLIFITSNRDIDEDRFEHMRASLQPLLPGIMVALVTGFDTVMHRAAEL